MDLGYSKSLIWLLFDMTGPSLPPYLLEVVMKDGRSFYIHKPIVRDEARASMVLGVYDFRGIDASGEAAIKSKLDEISLWNDEIELKDLHPLLTFGRLRCDLENILYCIEWLNRWWTLETLYPEISAPQKTELGFPTSEKDS